MFRNKSLALILALVFVLSISSAALATDTSTVTFTTQAGTLTVEDVVIGEALFSTTTYGGVSITTDAPTADIKVYAEQAPVLGGWTHMSTEVEVAADNYTIVFAGDGAKFVTGADIPIATAFAGSVSVQEPVSLAAGIHTLAAPLGVGVMLGSRTTGVGRQEISVTLQWQAMWE